MLNQLCMPACLPALPACLLLGALLFLLLGELLLPQGLRLLQDLHGSRLLADWLEAERCKLALRSSLGPLQVYGRRLGRLWRLHCERWRPEGQASYRDGPQGPPKG